MSANTQENAADLDGFISLDISEEFKHAVQVSHLAFHVAKEMDLEEEFCREVGVRG